MKFAALLMLLLAVSCGRKPAADFVPSPLAEAAVSDTSSTAYKTLCGYGDVGNAGAIAIFGGFEETAVMSEKLLTADMFDNIDAKTSPDGLPDFAGETVMPVFDAANAPYSGYFDSVNEDYIREIAVKGFLSMLSDRCSSSAFDRGLSAVKPRAKLVILSSSELSDYGYEDIEYIVSEAGLGVGVLNPVMSSVSHLYQELAEVSNIGVWASRDIVASGVYGSVFSAVRRDIAGRKDSPSAAWADSVEMVCLSPEPGDSPCASVKKFLDSYLDAEYSIPLAGVIVDDFVRASEVDSLNIAADSLMAPGNPESEKYGSIIAPGFRFVSPVETLASDSYLWLRHNDRFTHLVSRPGITGYMTAVSSDVQKQFMDADGWLAGDYKYNRAPGSEIETFRFIPMSQSCFDDESMERMRILAPETYKKLVYVY